MGAKTRDPERFGVCSGWNHGQRASAALNSLVAAQAGIALPEPVLGRAFEPTRAAAPEDWPWSSARAHLAGEDDELARVTPLRALVPDFAALLAAPADPETTARIERGPTIGRLLGAPEWMAQLERRLGRPASPGQNPEWSRPSSGKPDCCDALYKLSP
jgi:hypothetical protein